MEVAVGCACVMSSVTVTRKPENPFLANEVENFVLFRNAIKIY